MLAKSTYVAIPLLYLLGMEPASAVTHYEWLDGRHNTQLVRNGPTEATYSFTLDAGINVFTGNSDCSTMGWPDYVRCGEMFNISFQLDHWISGMRLWLWHPYEEAFPFVPDGSLTSFFDIGIGPRLYSGHNFSAYQSFTRDQAFGSDVRGTPLMEESMPIVTQYWEVAIDNPDGSITFEQWPTNAFTIGYDSPEPTMYRLEIMVDAVPELDGATGPMAAGFLLGILAWIRERKRLPIKAARG